MRLGIAAAALTGTLLFVAAQAATATPLPNLKDAAGASPGTIDLVRSPGGGGRGMGMRGGGPKMGGGVGRGHAMKGIAGKPGGHAGKAFKGGGGYARRGGPPNLAYKGGKYKGGGYAWKGNKGYKGGYASKGHKGYRYGRHGYPYFWPGVAWGGVGVYSSGGCGWLYRQAQATGSAYWWQRYQNCVYAY